MKRTFRILVTVYITVIVVVAACKKTEKNGSGTNIPVDVPVYNYGTDKTKLNQLFSAFKSTPQTFSVSAGTYQVITAAGGTKLTFYPNSFKNAAGTIITSGTVNISIIEMTRPGSMIANRATTTANGGLLKSGGQVNIKATMGGQEVFANKYGLAFPQQSGSAQRMAIYYGNANNSDSLTAWNISDTTAGLVALGTVATPDSSMLDSNYSYPFDSCTNFHWINCDYFYSYSPITNISVTATDTTFNSSNTEVFLVFPTINSVTGVNMYTPLTHTFSLYSGYQVPVGYTVDLVVIANVGGSYYYYQEIGVTITAGMAFHPVMAPHTIAYINSALAAL